MDRRGAFPYRPGHADCDKFGLAVRRTITRGDAEATDGQMVGNEIIHQHVYRRVVLSPGLLFYTHTRFSTKDFVGHNHKRQ